MNLEGLPYLLLLMDADDVPTVAAIEQQVFTLPWSPASFLYELEQNPTAYYVTLCYQPLVAYAWERQVLPRPLRRLLGAPKDDPALLGYGGMWLLLGEAHICTLAVRSHWRGRGLGELLLAALIEHALHAEAEVLTLEVRESNTAAQSLYTKHGFAVTGRRRHYYSDNGEDALIMSTGPIRSEAYRRHFDELCLRLRERLLLGDSRRRSYVPSASAGG